MTATRWQAGRHAQCCYPKAPAVVDYDQTFDLESEVTGLLINGAASPKSAANLLVVPERWTL
jgi:hypothetical protein